jgi:hypothetical protein
MLMIAGLMTAGGPGEAATPSDRIIQYLGFTPQEREDLLQGRIVSHKVKELSDKELAITMAVLVPASLADLLDFARSGKVLEMDRDILAHGTLGADATGDVETTAFQGVGFAPSEASEARALLDSEPGARFNLSQSESQQFAELSKTFQAKGCEKDPHCADAVATTLRSVLRDRLKAYRERGLSGIEPYARGDGRHADPAEELRNATNAAQFVGREYPIIFDAFLNYPKGDQSGMENHFLWLKQTVQDRPTFILAHRILCVRDGLAFAAERQFYVGHSYNSLQILYGFLPTQGKTLVVYLNRTSTDQVAGFMSGTRHDVGRKMMEKGVREEFEEILASLKSPQAR